MMFGKNMLFLYLLWFFAITNLRFAHELFMITIWKTYTTTFINICFFLVSSPSHVAAVALKANIFDLVLETSICDIGGNSSSRWILQFKTLAIYIQLPKCKDEIVKNCMPTQSPVAYTTSLFHCCVWTLHFFIIFFCFNLTYIFCQNFSLKCAVHLFSFIMLKCNCTISAWILRRCLSLLNEAEFSLIVEIYIHPCTHVCINLSIFLTFFGPSQLLFIICLL